MNKFIQLSRTPVSLLLASILAACGGSGSNNESEQPEAETPIAEAEVQTQLHAPSLKVVTLPAQSRMSNQSGVVREVTNGQVLNATGEFKHPKPQAEFVGNISTAIEVNDPDGISRVLLGFNESEQYYVLCEEDCDNPFDTFVGGISPQLFGAEDGEVILKVLVDDGVNPDLEEAANLAINWQGKVISGVSVTHDEDTETITVNWTADSDLLRYNVYIANDPTINADNVLELEGGEARRSLETNTVTFENKPVDQDYYVLISGVDGTGESAYSGTIILIGGSETVPPTANNDTFTVNEDEVLTGNVITNDSSNSDEAIVINLETPPTAENGTLVTNQDGSFTYTPNTNFNGTDQFNYEIINEAGLTSQAIASITITPVNDAPTSTEVTFIIDGDSLEQAAPGLLSNAVDIDGDSLSVSLSLITLPTFGSIQVFADGQFSYTAGETFVNYDTFQYQITDGLELVTVDASIVTADFNGSFPAIALSDTYTTQEDNVLTVAALDGLLANDFDEDGDINAAVIAITQAPSNGNLTFAQDGSFTYSPAQDFFGQDMFQYSLTDADNNVTSALVSLTVESQNDAPVANGDAYSVGNDMATTIFAGVGLLRNDSDVDGDSITVNLDTVTQPSSGSVEVNASGRFVYTPAADFVGTDSFTYQVTDGQANSNTATVSLSVFDVFADANDNEDLVFNIEDISSLFATNATLVGVSAEKGTATFTQDAVTFTPNYNESGFADIVLEFESQGENFNYTLTVRIIQTNQAPVFDSLTDVSVDENIGVDTAIVTLSASDSESHGLTFGLSDNAGKFEIDTNAGTLTLLDDASIDFETNTSFSMTATVTDDFGLSNTLTFSIAVNDLNENPSFTSGNSAVVDENPELGALIYTASATDPDDGDSVSFSLTSAVSGVQLDSTTGAISVSDNTVFDHESLESVTFKLMVTDTGGLSDSLDVTLTVNDANEAPSITSSNLLLDDVAENFTSATATDLYQFTVEDADESDSLTWTLTADANFNIDNQTGVIEIIANSVFDFESTSSYTLTATVTDSGGLTDSIELTLPISNVNEAPTANVDYVNVTNYSSVNIAVLTNDTDPESDTLIVTSASATNGSVAIESDYSLTYIPNNDITSDTITYTVEDIGGLTHTTTVEITVDPLGLAGSHDVNLDGSTDLTASYDSGNDVWTLDIANTVSNVFVVSSDRYYPIEKQSDSSFTTDLDGSVNDHEIRLIISGKIHVFKAVDLISSAAATIDFTGTTLTTNISDMDFPATFVDANPVWNGAFVNESIAVYPQIRRGATVELNDDGTGSYFNQRGQDTFTWTMDTNKVVVVQDVLESNTETLTIEDLLDLALITQVEYDDYVENTGNSGDQFSISSTQNSITMEFTSNQIYYFEVTETQNTTYTLPSEFSNREETIDETADEYRLYDLTRLGTYNADIGAGNYVLAYFEYTDGEPENTIAEKATLNADNTGSFDDLGVSFSWSINSAGNLEIVTDTNFTYEYVVVRGNDNQYAKEVYVYAWDSATSERLSALYFLVQDTAPTNADVLTKIENEHWDSAFGQRKPESFTNGIYNGLDVFGYKFETTQAQDAPTGEYAAKRIWSGESFLQISDWTWAVTDASVEMIRYFDFSFGLANCDPSSSSTCFPYQRRTWTVNHIDSVNNQIWVTENQEVLDFNAYYADGTVAYNANILTRLNYYRIAEQLTTSADTSSVDEDSSVTGIDVVANDLDSSGGNDVILLNTASSQGATTTNDDTTFDYTPNSDFNGADEVYYLVTDSNNGLGFNIATVTVNAINDAPTAVDDDLNVDEGMTYTVFDLTANDSDLDGDSIFVSTISSATNGSIIDNGDNSIDYVHDGSETTTDSFTYTLSDGALTSTATVNITINPVNDAPQFTTSTTNYSVDEGQSLTIDFDATDAEGDNITYSYSTSVGAPFSINSSTGELTFSAQNYESPIDDGGDNSYDIDILIDDDGSPSESTSLSIVITVQDVNDAPTLSNGGTSFTIQENDTSVTTLTASDEDASETLTFSLTGDDASAFAINSSTGVITFASAPNYDSPSDANSDNVYVIDAVVTDSGSLTDTLSYSITVSDLNESPTLTNGTTSVNVDENQTTVLTATATDEDAGTTLTYSLSGLDAALFNIGSSTGVITFVSAPDHESPSDYDVDGQYDFDVSVSDGNSSDTLSFSVIVNDINEAPTLTNGTTSFNVNENQTAVATATATDVDASDSQAFSISGTDASVFSIGGSSGVITFNSAPDFESPTDSDANGTYSFDITVTDNDGLTDTLSFSVTLDDVNEAATFTSSDTTSAPENQTAILTVTASDPENDTLTFSKNGGADPEFFNVTSVGVVTFSTAPDFEGMDDANSDNVYEVQIDVVDASGSGTTVSQTLKVTLTDANESPSITSGSTVNIEENSVNGTSLYTPTATDPEGDTLTWTLTDGSGIFAVNSSSGEVTVNDNSNLDFETLPTTSITLSADDSVSSPVSLTVTVSIDDVVENVELKGDATFGYSAVSTFNTYTSAQNNDEIPVALVKQSDGNLLHVVNHTDENAIGKIYVVRTSTEGKNDITYGVSGQSFISFTDSVTATKAIIDSSDNLYIIGYQTVTSVDTAIIIKIDSSGSLDTSFDGDGLAVVNLIASGNSRATDLLQYSGGSLFLAATGITSQSFETLKIVEVNASTGAMTEHYDDDAIGGGAGGAKESNVALVENSSANIVAIGDHAGGAHNQIYMAEFDINNLSAGPVATSVADYSNSIAGNGGHDYVYSYEISHTATDRVYIGGQTNANTSDRLQAFVSYIDIANVAVDTAFATNGFYFYDADPFNTDPNRISSIAQDNTGNVVLAAVVEAGNYPDYYLRKLTSAGVDNQAGDVADLNSAVPNVYPDFLTDYSIQLFIDEADINDNIYLNFTVSNIFSLGADLGYTVFSSDGTESTTALRFASFSPKDETFYAATQLTKGANSGEFAVATTKNDGEGVGATYSYISSDGFVDKTYHYRGHLHFNGGGDVDLEQIGVIEGADGDLIIANYYVGDIQIYKQETSGFADATFVDPSVTTFTSNMVPTGMVYDSVNDHIIIYGYDAITSDDLLFIRINATNGDLYDPGSGIFTDALGTIDLGGGSTDRVIDVVPQADGTMIVFGSTTLDVGGDVTTKLFMQHLNTDGSVADTTFDDSDASPADDVFTFALSSAVDYDAVDIIQTSTDEIFVVGNQNGGTTLDIAKFDLGTKALDANFGTAGVSTISIGADVDASGFVLSSTDALYLFGKVSNGTDYDGFVAEIDTTNGGTKSTFNGFVNQSGSQGYFLYDEGGNETIDHAIYTSSGQLLIFDSKTGTEGKVDIRMTLYDIETDDVPQDL